jgi:hypothetical protein
MTDRNTRTYAYVAGGKRITLKPDNDSIGLRLADLDASLQKKLRASASPGMQVVNSELAVVAKTAIPAAALTALRERGLLFPVFADAGTKIIALPEVRVEPPSDTTQASRKELSDWLSAHSADVRVVSEGPDRLVLAPRSGYGPDAVVLADDIARAFKSFSASPRFLRITARTK